MTVPLALARWLSRRVLHRRRPFALFLDGGSHGGLLLPRHRWARLSRSHRHAQLVDPQSQPSRQLLPALLLNLL